MSTESIKQALAVQEARAEAGTIYDALDLHRAALERKVPVGILTYGQAEAALKTELRANDKLREADPAKVLGAFSHSLSLGLMVGPLGLVYLIPYSGDVEVVVGYRGYVELALRSNLVKSVVARLVHDGDTFRVVYGTAEKIVHEPAGPPGEREIVAAYGVAHLKTGGTVFEPIYEADWEKARKASQLGAKRKGPWVEHRPEMIRKTAIRRLEKWLPKTPAIMYAATVDDQPAEPFEGGEIPGLVESATDAA